MNKINKKKATIVALLIIALLVWMASFVLADSNPPPVVQAVTLSDLGVTSVGLLPSNPFYFSEEWLRGVQKIFATDPLSQTTLELQILNNKAAELLTASELTPADPSGLDDAITNYGNELQTMSADLETLNTKNSQVDSLLSNVTAKLYMHYEILEGIKVQYGDSNGQIASMQNEIETIVSEVPNYMTDNSQFGTTLTNAVTAQTDLGAQLRSLPFLDELQEINTNPSIRSQIDQVRQSQALNFEGRYDADGLSPNVIPGIVEQLPVGDVSKVILVGDLQNLVVDNGLSSSLSTLDGALLTQASNTNEISSEDVSNLVNYTDGLVTEIGTSTQSNDLNQVSTLLSAATSDLVTDSYGIAFGEAQSAALIADGILINSDNVTINSTSSIANLSNQLSVLEENAVSQGIDNTDDPKLFDLFNQVDVVLLGTPSVNDVYQVEESLDELNFALNNSAQGFPSDLIPVPGEATLQGTANNESALATVNNGVPQYCPEVYEPVCGSDGITYSNLCFDGLVNVSTDYKGECRVVSATSTESSTPTSTTTSVGSN